LETLFIHLQISCFANVDKFALLDTEGDTQIHTTVLGNCTVTDIRNGLTFNNNGNALLELKKKYQ